MIKKYLATFRNTFLNLLINFIAFSILPKSISLSEYGVYQFATSFFTNLRNLLNMAATGGVFQLSSKYKNSTSVLNLYALFLLMQIIALFLILFFIDALGYLQGIFDSDDLYLIAFIAAVEFVNFVFIFLLSYGDAKGITVEFQRIKTYELLARGSSLLLLYYLHMLTLYHFLIVVLAFALVSAIVLLRKLSFFSHFSIEKKKQTVLLRKVAEYSLPLAVVEIVAVFYNMSDIFLIQSMLGTETFAVYIYAYKFLMVVLIFIQPMFNIFWQYSAKNFEKNKARLRSIFDELFVVIFSLSIIFMLFLMVFSQDTILLFTDERYLKSAEYLSFLSIMVIPMALEKLAVVILYSTHNTKSYRNIVVIGSLLSIAGSLLIFALYKLHIISGDWLVWIVMGKIVVYSYLLNGYIAKKAMDILGVHYIGLFKKVAWVFLMINVANVHLVVFDFSPWITFALFAVFNTAIMGYMLLSFKIKIERIGV